MRSIAALWAAAALASGCHLSMKGLDQAQLLGAEPHPAPDIQVPDGFRAVRVVQGLDFPSSMAWDAEGSLYILESHTVPVPMTYRRILKVVGQHLEEVKMDGPEA